MWLPLLPTPIPTCLLRSCGCFRCSEKGGRSVKSGPQSKKKKAAPQRPEQIHPSLRSPHVVATPRWHLRGGGRGRGRREEERNGEFRSPGSRNEETCVLGEPKRTTFLPLLQIFAEQAVCPRMHSSGPAVVSPCCFANSGWKGWKTSPALPSHPVIPATPLVIVPSPPTPTSRRLLTVWLSSFLGAEIWVG